MAELFVVAHGDLEALAPGGGNELASLDRSNRERFLDVDMAAAIEALHGELEVCRRRRGEVHDVNVRLTQKPIEIDELLCDTKPRTELPGHQWLAIAGC